VSGDGTGLHQGFDINATGTLGLRLVKIPTEDQLLGSMGVISKEWATFNMEFDTKY
jgi:two-component sensor histidine kinase